MAAPEFVTQDAQAIAIAVYPEPPTSYNHLPVSDHFADFSLFCSKMGDPPYRASAGKMSRDGELGGETRCVCHYLLVDKCECCRSAKPGRAASADRLRAHSQTLSGPQLHR